MAQKLAIIAGIERTLKEREIIADPRPKGG